MISINEEEILVVFKKDCGISKAKEVLEEDCEIKSDNLWEPHHILVGILKSGNKSYDALRRLNSDYRNFIEVAVYNYEDSKFIK